MRLYTWLILAALSATASALYRPRAWQVRKDGPANGVRWRPVYAWGKLRYDPWVLRHPGIWFYGLSLPRVEVAEIKRSRWSRALRSRSKWSLFLRRSRLLGGIPGRTGKSAVLRSQRRKILKALDRATGFKVGFPVRYPASRERNNEIGDDYGSKDANGIEDKLNKHEKKFALSANRKASRDDGDYEPWVVNNRDEKPAELVDETSEPGDVSLLGMFNSKYELSQDEGPAQSEDMSDSMVEDYPSRAYDGGLFGDGQFGGFLDDHVPESPTHTSSTPCGTKRQAVCSREADCECNGSYFCISGRCSTHEAPAGSGILDQITFVKRSAPVQASRDKTVASGNGRA